MDNKPLGSFYKTTDTTKYKGVTGHNIRSSIQGDKKEKQFSPFLGELRLVRTNPNGSLFANHTSKANARVLQVIEFINSSCLKPMLYQPIKLIYVT